MGGFEKLKAQRIPPDMSEMVWDAVPESRRSRSYDGDASFPDYEADTVSYGDDWFAEAAMSHRGPGYKQEK